MTRVLQVVIREIKAIPFDCYVIYCLTVDAIHSYKNKNKK
jgi:hypothetical protein